MTPFGPFGLFGARFDLPEFFIGLAAGLLLVWTASRLRPVSSWLGKQFTGRVRQAATSFTAGAKDRFDVELIEQVETMHAAGNVLALSDILVSPRLLAPAPMTDPMAQDQRGAETLSVLPNLPDASYLSAVYGATSLPLVDAVGQGQSMLLTGPVGSGKSTALAYLALEGANGRLRTADNQRRLPLFVHAGDFQFNRDAAGDALDPLIRATQERASSGLRSRLPAYIRQHVETGSVLLLLDGLDEVPVEQLAPYASWLTRLVEAELGIQVVAAGPVRGYDGLLATGLAPVNLAPWTDDQQRVFLRRWGSAWREHAAPLLKRSQLDDLDPALVSGWLSGVTRGLTPMELTLRGWAAHAGDLMGASILESYEAHLRRFVDAEEQQAAAAAGVAWIEQRQAAFEESALRRGTPVSDLIEAGLLVRRAGNRLSFAIPAIGCYLAGQGMQSLGVPQSVDGSYWGMARAAHAFHIALGEAADEVEHALASGPDPLERSSLRVGDWLRLSPESASWRPAALRALGKLIQDSKRAYGLRLRATHAMAESHEPTAAVFFRRLLASEHPSSRILGALGLGGLRDLESTNELKAAVTNDRDIRVRQAACLALAALGSEPALEGLGEALLHGEEAVRVAAAEALANHPDEGYEMLKEAATIDDLLTRRAAVFGLARIPDSWAREQLEKLQVDDKQWVVRGAAAEALEKRQNPPYPVQPPVREVADLPWLVAYASKAGLAVAPGRPALEMLRRAINQGNQDEQVAALETLGWIDEASFGLELKNALNGGEPYLRDTAFEALWRQGAAVSTSPETSAGD
jgi:HEAT repeat protein